MDEKINNDELNKVSGGKTRGSIKKVVCPNCKRDVLYSKAHKYTKKKSCNSNIAHYECPLCSYKWDVEC